MTGLTDGMPDRDRAKYLEDLKTAEYMRDNYFAALNRVGQVADAAEAENADLRYRLFEAQEWKEQGRLEAELKRVREGLRETKAALDRERGGGSPLTYKQYLALHERVRALLAGPSGEAARVPAGDEAKEETPADWDALNEGDVISLRVFDPRWGWEREARTVTRVFSDRSSISFFDKDAQREYTVKRDDEDWQRRQPLLLSHERPAGEPDEGGEA